MHASVLRAAFAAVARFGRRASPYPRVRRMLERYGVSVGDRVLSAPFLQAQNGCCCIQPLQD